MHEVEPALQDATITVLREQGWDGLTLERVAEVAAAPLSEPALDLASAAWAALRADEPGGLGAIARTPDPVLRFLAEAFDRLGREYPSTRDGLSLTERRILAAVAAGASTAGAVFAAVGLREARPFLGDTYCFRMIARLASARTPLLAVAARVELTAAGRRVLDGADDHVGLSGIDRWVGGVHLAGAASAWRWHEGTEAIVPG